MISLNVVHDYAYGGDEEEVVPITRRALAQIHRELSEARARPKRAPKGRRGLPIVPLDVGGD